MCTTMNELEKVVADYRSLKAMKEELDAQLKDAEREMISYLDNNNKLSESEHWTVNSLKQTSEVLQITRE